jgi:taurine dioxygenase
MAVGAEVSGLAPGSEQDSQVRRALYEAWLQHAFLVFRDVEAPSQQIAISKCFGELELHPVPEIRVPENPYLVEFGGAGRAIAYVYDQDVRAGRIPWHRDTAFTLAVCKGAMLRVIRPTREGGETMLADTARAYDELPAQLKARIDDLEYRTILRSDPLTHLGPWAGWTQVRLPTEHEDPLVADRAPIQNKQERYPSVVHPVVLPHPDSRRRCIFITPRDFDCFLGMSRAESDELLRELVGHMTQAKYVYTHVWRAGDALLWDNLRCVHAACGYSPLEDRYAQRTTLAGAVHSGRYFDPGARPAPAPTMMD